MGADGADSNIRKSAEISAKTISYDQVGLVCTVQLETPFEPNAWQRFLPTGPIALLPVKFFFFQSLTLENIIENSFYSPQGFWTLCKCCVEYSPQKS